MLLFSQTQRVLCFSSRVVLKRSRRQQPSNTRLRAISTTIASTAPHTKTLFDLDLCDGHCVGIELDASMEDESLEGWGDDSSHWVHSCLHPQEIEYAEKKSRASRKSFLVGRLAMRASLMNNSSEMHQTPPCLKDDQGRPTMPSSHLGSISHKGNLGVALTTPASSPRTGVGVDIENHAPNKRSIAKKILTPREISELGKLEDVSADEEVMLRFSLKEAVYKAIHPLLNQYVGFQEAEVTPLADGTAVLRWNLNSGAHKQLDRVEAHWHRLDDYFLTSSTCSLKEE